MASDRSNHLKVVGADEPALELPEEAVSSLYNLAKKPETTAQRVKRLQAEARMLALEEIEGLELALIEAGRRAQVISEGGDAYPVGVREHARQLAEELPLRAGSLKLLAARA
jgi:hypothetical protein